jgi:hypothetical protein
LENQKFCHKPLNISFKAIPKKFLLDPMIRFSKIPSALLLERCAIPKVPFV